MSWRANKKTDGTWVVTDNDSNEVVGEYDNKKDAQDKLRQLYSDEAKAPSVKEAAVSDQTVQVDTASPAVAGGDMDAIQRELAKCQNILGVIWGYPAIPIDPTDPPDPEIIKQLQGETPVPGVTAAATAEQDVVLARTEQWHSMCLPLDVRSGDGRTFDAAGVSWRDLPMTLKWAPESYGEHTGAFVVGAITRVEVSNGGVDAWGVFALNEDGTLTDDAADAVVAIRGGMLTGVSVEIDDVVDADIEMLWPADVALDPNEPLMPEAPGGTADVTVDDITEMMAQPDSVIFHHYRIAALCLVDVPAFQETFVELLGSIAIPPPSVQTAETPGAEPVVAAGYVIEIPDCPERAWYNRPTDNELSAGSLTLTDEGRIYGWLAPPGVFHQGRPDKIKAPQGVDYSHFLRGETFCADGSRIVTGNLTMECGHAGLSQDLHAAAEHYDNTCSVFATVNVGEYKGGTWMAGAILPDVAPAQVRRALACQASGDWRARDDGRYGRKLAAALLVPVPGFSKARTRATSTVRSEGGELQLVASAVPVQFRQFGAQARNRSIADRIARTVGLDYRARADKLASRVNGVRDVNLNERLNKMRASVVAAAPPPPPPPAPAADAPPADAAAVAAKIEALAPTDADHVMEMVRAADPSADAAADAALQTAKGSVEALKVMAQDASIASMILDAIDQMAATAPTAAPPKDVVPPQFQKKATLSGRTAALLKAPGA